MRDELAIEAVRHGDDDRIREILGEVCRLTGMGFAAVARVTPDRWIACQVSDRICFGLRPGDELKVQETICDEIRDCGEAIFIDHVMADSRWRTHPVPAQYGFQSYASLPLYVGGAFYGTLCAIDPAPRAVKAESMIEVLTSYVREIEGLISRTVNADAGQGIASPGA